MSEFEEKLNAILSNPEAMAQVASIAQSLGGGQPAQQQSAQSQGPPQQSVPAPQGGAMPDLGAISSMLGQLDPGVIQKFLPLVGELNSPRNGQREQLLYALRPYLKESRRDKVDQALQVARVLHLGKKFLGTLGDGHV